MPTPYDQADAATIASGAGEHPADPRAKTLAGLTPAQADGSDARDPVKLVCTRIAKLKDRMIGPEVAPSRVRAMIAQADQARTHADAAGLRLAARVYPEYQRRLREANAADFGDLLLWPARAMQCDETYRRRVSEKFDYILADEYQDVCYVQYM